MSDWELLAGSPSTQTLEHIKTVHFLDRLTEYVSSLICLPGAVFNATLILLILKRTPPQMRSYAVYLLNFAVFDFATCILSFFSCQKVIFSGFSLIYVFHGPCKLVSSWFCYFCHCFECHTLAHSQWILLASFLYRYKVLLGKRPTVKDVLLSSFGFYSMSLCFLLFYLFDMSDPKELLQIMASLHPEYHYDDNNLWKNLTLSGNISMFSPITFLSILYMTFPCVPIYCAILFFRHNTLAVLGDTSLNFSANTKVSHQKLVKALTVQALIPIFWLVASAIYTSAQFGLIEGPIPENLTFRLMDCIPMVSPIVTIFFIETYRQSLINALGSSSKFFLAIGIGSSVVDITQTTRDLEDNNVGNIQL